MTINSLQANQSTVVSGLGTQTFNVVTAGPYTCSFKSFLPYAPAGTPVQTTVPSAAIDNITFLADSAGNLNSTFFTFYSAGNLQGFYLWFNINSAGVDPAPAGLTGIVVAGATNATANTLATAARAAVLANASAASYFAVSGATSHLILTDIQPGTKTAAADGTAATSFTFTPTAGNYGAPAMSGLNVVINQGTTVLGRFGFPSATQPILGGSVTFTGAASDVITVVLTSLSTADSQLNAVKTIVNLFQGVGA